MIEKLSDINSFGKYGGMGNSDSIFIPLCYMVCMYMCVCVRALIHMILHIKFFTLFFFFSFESYVLFNYSLAETSFFLL